ncbi:MULTISPECIES: hypothetical protein [unclassified Pseudomonas]|uniref:hypothetical protein n=1 Tax=unclassified Pseudomonas TaxID=196821 RepID=UPI000C88538E|nr:MULTISPECIES: hypothetical protein [unclassified Pseudomonas]
MPLRTLPSHLSLPELNSARNTGTDVQGVGVEADADRLLISSQFSEAAEAYRTLDLDNVNRREKLAYCLYCAGQRDFHTVLEDDVELATPWGWRCICGLLIAADFPTTRPKRSDQDGSRKSCNAQWKWILGPSYVKD